VCGCVFVTISGYLKKFLTDLDQILWNDRPSFGQGRIDFGIDLDPRSIFSTFPSLEMGVLGIKYELKVANECF